MSGKIANMKSDWVKVRSFFEAPILDERKWAKVPSIAADAFFLDLEDSVPPQRKDEARLKVLSSMSEPDYFHGSFALPRVNHLNTPWGHEDVLALGAAGADAIMYPKVERIDEILELVELFETVDAHPVIAVSIESARGVVDVESLLAHSQVFVVAFGAADFALDTGQDLYDGDGRMNHGLDYAKCRTALVAAAHGLGRLSVPWVHDVRNLDEVRLSAERERRLGFTGGIAFYPPHVEILNDVFGHSEGDVARARKVVSTYEAARSEGKTGIQLDNGEVILVHQYVEAQRLLENTETRS